MNHLERALDQQNQWWKYLIFIVGGLLAANVIGAIPMVAVVVYKLRQPGNQFVPTDNIADLSAYGISPNLGLFLMIFPFVIGLIAVILLLKPLHKRTYKEVINGTNRVRWNKFLYAFLILGAMMMIYFAVEYALDPKNFQLSFNANAFITLVILSILLIPFQTAYEELLFRGYLTQGIAAWTKSRWLAIIIPALLFGLMHALNPEVKEYGFWATMPSYWIFGLIFGLITILDDGIESAWGMHAANNILTSIFVTNKSSVLQTPALFNQQHIDIHKETVALGIIGAISVLILARKYNWQFSVLGKKVEKQMLTIDYIDEDSVKLK